VAILVSASLFYIFAGQEVADEFYKAHQTVKHTKEMFLPWLIGANVLALVLAFILAIMPSHKIAGPIFHLEKDLKKIKNGEFPRKIRVRKGDVLGEFAENLDESMKSISGRIIGLRNSLRELDRYASTLEDSGSLSAEPLQQIKKKISGSLFELDFFKIESSDNENQGADKMNRS
jgi:methyl-accepting chemotaxis protein